MDDWRGRRVAEGGRVWYGQSVKGLEAVLRREVSFSYYIQRHVVLLLTRARYSVDPVYH